jgi:hypothetical protein
VPDQAAGGPQPFVVSRLLRQVREQMPQVSARMADPPRLRGKPEQSLQHGQGHQLGVAELRRDTCCRPQRRELRGFLQQVVGSYVQCGCEGV